MLVFTVLRLILFVASLAQPTLGLVLMPFAAVLARLDKLPLASSSWRVSRSGLVVLPQTALVTAALLVGDCATTTSTAVRVTVAMLAFNLDSMSLLKSPESSSSSTNSTAALTALCWW